MPGTLRQTIVQPLGLINTPNTYGQYPPGALSVAQNIVMRAPGEVWQAPGFGTQVATFGGASDILRKLYPLDSGHVYAWTRDAANTWTVSEAGVAATLPTSAVTITNQLFSDEGQITPIRMRERMLFPSIRAGVFVGDSMAPTNATERALRSACMPQPLVSALTRTTTNAATLPNGVCVGYAALLKRTFTDGYEIFSVPSPIYRFPNIVDGVTVDVSLTIAWNTGANSFGVVAGDIIEIYRTDGLVSNSANSDPGDTLKLINVHTITAGEVIAGTYTYRDTTICQSPLYQTIGRELYTNPGQESALQANRQPNICRSMAKFKTFAFYGDVTERPRWTFQVPAGFGNSGGAAPMNTVWWRTNGIGTRGGAGTITGGSPTVTAVSAADMVGVAVGQIWLGSGLFFASTATVISKTINSFTMSSNALGPGAAWFLADQITLNGTPIRAADLGDLIASIAATGAYHEITIDTSIPPTLVGPYVTGATITIEPTRPAQTNLSVTATNSVNYQEPVPEWGSTAKVFLRTRSPNLLQWSKDNQPEHVPPSNETNVGAGSIIAMAATKNALWIFCTDGLYRLSGDAPPWRVDLVDPSCVLVAPQALTQLRDTIFAYTNYGIVAITDVGIGEITSQLLQETFPGPAYSLTPTVIVERNELDDEIVVSLGTNILYVYNTKQKSWTYLSSTPNSTTADITALAFQRTPASGAAVLLVGTSTSGQVPRYAPWNPGAVNFLAGDTRYQPFYGDDPLTMKQFIDETLLFNPADAGKTVTVSELGVTIASSPLTLHNSDAYGTVGVPRRFAISQSAAPGFTMLSSATQFRFRGISLRFAAMANQAWRT